MRQQASGLWRLIHFSSRDPVGSSQLVIQMALSSVIVKGFSFLEGLVFVLRN